MNLQCQRRTHTLLYFFFFNDTATTEIYTLSLHDALPICRDERADGHRAVDDPGRADQQLPGDADLRQQHDRAPQQRGEDRKSTRLNSSHANISYAVFCLKKKK